ncbi:hypothetical protein L8R84_16920 [Vibrio splendidus]|uniref:hypothetical protein n=1 Tax=Vibrio splendidus TaxID=29497 RepID=UPI002469A841|nr:hypothetical protein [Vibrio splendidus]MDH5937808.1 hypothetical protein [Vibrio splendidus]
MGWKQRQKLVIGAIVFVIHELRHSLLESRLEGAISIEEALQKPSLQKNTAQQPQTPMHTEYTKNLATGLGNKVNQYHTNRRIKALMS